MYLEVQLQVLPIYKYCHHQKVQQKTLQQVSFSILKNKIFYNKLIKGYKIPKTKKHFDLLLQISPTTCFVNF